mgnify:CR=1 FL=1
MNKKEYLEKLLASHWEEGEGIGEVGTVAEVAGHHGQTIWPDDLPGDMTIDDPVRRWRRGYNSKRPSYVIRTASGRLYPAYGTFFGQSSYFRVSRSVITLADGQWKPEFVLSPEERTRYNFLPDPAEERVVRDLYPPRRVILASTFSPAMLGPGASANVREIYYLPREWTISAVAHEVTAQILTALLGRQVDFNRETLTLEKGDYLYAVIPNFRATESREFTKEEVSAAGFRSFLAVVS